MKRHKRRSQKQWEVLISEQASSDQSIEKFCEEKDVSEASFHRWRQTFESKKAASKFVELQGGHDLSKRLPVSTVELDFGDGRVLRVMS